MKKRPDQNTLTLVMILFLACFALTACGRKKPVSPPPESHYPRSYPPEPEG